MKRLTALALLLIVALPLQAEPVRVLATVPPLAMVAMAVAQPDTEVKALLPAGVEPHDYRMAPSDLETVRKADIVVWLGAEAEPYLASVLAKPAEGQQVINLSKLPGVVLRDLRLDPNDTKKHGRDPHMWLSTENAALVARALGARLGSTLAAEHFAAEMQRYRSRQQVRFAPLAQSPLLVAHDAYGYLLAEFGLQNVSAVVLDPHHGHASARRVNELAQRVKREQIGCMIGEPGFAEGVGKRLFPEGHGNLVVIDPMLSGISPARDAYLIALIHLADTLYGCMVTR